MGLIVSKFFVNHGFGEILNHLKADGSVLVAACILIGDDYQSDSYFKFATDRFSFSSSLSGLSPSSSMLKAQLIQHNSCGFSGYTI